MNKKTQLKSAYIDGEMSPTEYLDFEKTLSEKEINNLKADTEFEKALGNHLNSGPACPDDLWQSLKAQIEDRNEAEASPEVPVIEETEQTKRPIKFSSIFMPLIAAAAAVFITLSVQDKAPVPTVDDNIAQNQQSDSTTIVANSPKLWTIPVSLEVMKHQEKNVKGLQEAQQLLVANDFNIDITKPNKSYHDIEFLGAKKEIFNGEELIVLYYACCGEPMKVLVTCAGGEACDQISKELKSNPNTKVKIDKIIDKYRLALIGEHYSNDVLDTIAGPQI